MSRTRLITALAVVAIPFFSADHAFAHCDGIDGPVVRAAQNALQTGNVNLVRIWVNEASEPELESVFRQTLAVRTLSAESRRLADRHFFETLVRLHRMGEGAPYTGLKEAGRDLGPAIPAADRALETGDLDPLETLLVNELRRGLHESFEHTRNLQKYDTNDVAAGREFVEAYVQYIHYVERMHEAIATAAAGHYAEAHE